MADYYKFYSHLRLNTFSKSTILQEALDLNLPSVYITNLEREEGRVVRRAITNVGVAHATYAAIIDSSVGVNVAVETKELRFNNTISHHSFKLKISTKETTKGVYKFGFVWIPIVICIVLVFGGPRIGLARSVSTIKGALVMRTEYKMQIIIALINFTCLSPEYNLKLWCKRNSKYSSFPQQPTN